MGIFSCCVDGCKSKKKDITLYNIPTHDGLREVWLKLLIPKSPSLANMTKEQLVQRKVCQLHFEEKYLTAGNRRKQRLACPTLFSENEILSRKPATPIKISFKNLQADHNYSALIPENTPGPSPHQDQLRQNEEDVLLRLKYINLDHPYALNSKRQNIVLKIESVSQDANATPSTSGTTSSEVPNPVTKGPTPPLLHPQTSDQPSSSGATDPVTKGPTPPLSLRTSDQPSSSGAIATISNYADTNAARSRVLPSADTSPSSSGATRADPVTKVPTPPVSLQTSDQPSSSGATAAICNYADTNAAKSGVLPSADTSPSSSGAIHTGSNSNDTGMQSLVVQNPSSSGATDSISGNRVPVTVTQSHPTPSARASDRTRSKSDDPTLQSTVGQKPSSSGDTDTHNKTSRNRIVRSINNLTPKCKSIYKKCVQIIKSKRRLIYNYSEKLEKARELNEKQSFSSMIESMTPQAKTFLRMQINLADKHIKRRRFTTEEKLLALSLAKQSPKGYKLLHKIFILPSRRTLNKFTQKIKFKPGVNRNIISQLKESVKNWDPIKKTCSVVFDEVALSPQLTYVESEDRIDGFVNFGQESEQKFCDHALVFMVRGICTSWRQPLAYYLCEGATPAITLKNILKDVVQAVVDTGLDPNAIVCDQGSTFQACINSLRADTRRNNILNNEPVLPDNQVIISGKELNVVFDPPHLIKGIRNNFLTKNMLFCGKIAKWQDIIDAYQTDCEVGEIRMVRKLTDEHVIPAKIKKMKVKNATQTLSEQTAGLLSFCSKFSVDDHGKPVSKTMKNTSDAVLFFDRLFDSVNGSRSGAAPGKMRGPVKEVNGKSAHVSFWEDALKILDDIYYVDSHTNEAVSVGGLVKKSVPSLKNWILTLKSFINIWGHLKQMGVKFFYTRNLNQDPLENFFGRVRAFNHRNNNPTPYHFACTVKSLVVNNILGPHSPGSNCEDDVGEAVLKSGLLFDVEDLDTAASFNSVSEPAACASGGAGAVPMAARAAAGAAPSGGAAQPQPFSSARREKINVQASAFTAGYVTRRLIRSVPCKDCKKTMLTNEIGDIHDWISQRERRLLKGRNLKYPNTAFICLFRKLIKFVNKYLDNSAHKGDVMKNIRTDFLKNAEVDWLGCDQHHAELLNHFMTLVCRVQIHNWCNSLNKILRGMFCEKLTTTMSKMQSLAHRKYKSSRGKK